WVVTDLAGVENTLKIIAKENLSRQGHNGTDKELEELVSPVLSFDKGTALFRQLCLFYDSLWYKLLLPELMGKTGRVPSDSREVYRAAVRQKIMEVIATAENLPKEWRNWDTEVDSTDMQDDFKFYMHGIVPPARQDEFDLILNFTQARGK